MTVVIPSPNCVQARCDDLLADHVALTDDLGSAHETIARLEGEKAALADSVRTLAERVQKLEAFKRTLIASLQVSTQSFSWSDVNFQTSMTVVYEIIDAFLSAAQCCSDPLCWNHLGSLRRHNAQGPLQCTACVVSAPVLQYCLFSRMIADLPSVREAQEVVVHRLQTVACGVMPRSRVRRVTVWFERSWPAPSRPKYQSIHRSRMQRLVCSHVLKPFHAFLMWWRFMQKNSNQCTACGLESCLLPVMYTVLMYLRACRPAQARGLWEQRWICQVRRTWGVLHTGCKRFAECVLLRRAW